MKIETALLLIPPLEVQQFTAPLRARLAADMFPLFPAHITLMYPFVPYEEHDHAADILRRRCLDISPFEVTLDHYDRFPTVLFLAPRDPAPIQNLYSCISTAFPEHIAYGGKYGDELHPHLTLGEGAPASERVPISLPAVPELTFNVDRLFIYAGIAESDRKGPVPFIPISVIPLRGAHDRPPG